MSDSPVKKLDFESAGKENVASLKPTDAPVDKMGDKIVEAPKVAPGIKEAEANEPLLQENPHRFVLFPIKYHEVSYLAYASVPRVKWHGRGEAAASIPPRSPG
jgi:ribonucleoside-diphosphate reductase subunit M2